MRCTVCKAPIHESRWELPMICEECREGFRRMVEQAEWDEEEDEVGRGIEARAQAAAGFDDEIVEWSEDEE